MTRALLGEYVRTADGYSLEHRFTLEAGVDSTPPPPITGNAEGARPELVVLRRQERGDG